MVRILTLLKGIGGVNMVPDGRRPLSATSSDKDERVDHTQGEG